MSSPIVGPVAPESNPPINPQYYEPSRFVISAISLGKTTLVTTSISNNYVVGQNIRLLIAPTYGANQLNNKTGYVLSILSSTQVEVGINSQNTDAFNPSGTGTTQPQIIAIGDINSGQTNASGPSATITYIPGSFINISPQ